MFWNNERISVNSKWLEITAEEMTKKKYIPESKEAKNHPTNTGTEDILLCISRIGGDCIETTIIFSQRC